MQEATDTFITFTPRSAAWRMARAKVRMSPALRWAAMSSAVGCAGPNDVEDCRMEISVASGATPTIPSGAPGGRPGTSGCLLASPGPAAGASSGGGGGGGGGGGRRGGGGGGAGVGVGGAAGPPAPAGRGGRPAGRIPRGRADDGGHHGAVAFAVGQTAVRR